MTVKAARKAMGKHFPELSLIFCGRLSPLSLIQKMCEAHIYVNASYIENGPNSLAEAMHLGMPCISTLAGGSGTYIKDRENGLTVQAGDSLGLAGAIVSLNNDMEWAQGLGVKARETALSRHDRARIRQKILDAYGDIIALNKRIGSGHMVRTSL
jgi:glycosyltransferase involved in cell wall biosynthesis